jgi:outer membrane protein insertion porin family
VSLSSTGLPVSALGETLYTHPRLRITQTIDFRDSPILPTKGWHVINPLEIGAAVGNVTTGYVQSGLSGGWYQPINAKYRVALGGNVGFIIPTGDGVDFPIDMRLFNGGAHSVRSFPERDLGPTIKSYATGGEASWNANAELIRKISGSVSAVAFLDAGALSRHFDEIGASKVNLAAGLGVRLDLPIGPVRLEYGYNLTRDEGEPSGTLHFAIGATF